MSADFPTAVTTQLLNGAARLSTTLTDDILASAATVYVAATSGFPSAGFITIGNETKEYTGTTALTFTGCSNVNGVDAAHSNGDDVLCAISAEHINRLNEEVVATQTKVGKDSATDTDSLDYKVNNAAGIVKTNTIITTSITSSATPTPARASKSTLYNITALAADAEFGAPTGTAVDGDSLLIRITDNATARALTWNAAYTDGTSERPTTTTISTRLVILFIYDGTKWRCEFSGEDV